MSWQKIETGQTESKMSLTVQQYGQKTGFNFNIRGFLAAGAENMSIENATKEFTLDDQIKQLTTKLESIQVGPKNETSS